MTRARLFSCTCTSMLSSIGFLVWIYLFIYFCHLLRVRVRVTSNCNYLFMVCEKDQTVFSSHTYTFLFLFFFTPHGRTLADSRSNTLRIPGVDSACLDSTSYIRRRNSTQTTSDPSSANTNYTRVFQRTNLAARQLLPRVTAPD